MLLLLLLLLLSRFSRVQLHATPQTAAHQAPPSLGFSRQEHWSGLPFPSPMRESEVTQSCPTLATPWTAAHQAPPSMGFSRQKYWSGVPLPSPTDYTYQQNIRNLFKIRKKVSSKTLLLLSLTKNPWRLDLGVLSPLPPTKSFIFQFCFWKSQLMH